MLGEPGKLREPEKLREPGKLREMGELGMLVSWWSWGVVESYWRGLWICRVILCLIEGAEGATGSGRWNQLGEPVERRSRRSS